jgi:hypothetical protein
MISISGATCIARSMSTVSWNDDASATSGPNRSHAHSITAVAGAVSNRRETALSSCRSGRLIVSSAVTGKALM